MDPGTEVIRGVLRSFMLIVCFLFVLSITPVMFDNPDEAVTPRPPTQGAYFDMMAGFAASLVIFSYWSVLMLCMLMLQGFYIMTFM